MAYSAGVYTLPGAALVDGQDILATEHNTLRNDMATAFNQCYLRDGTATATANLPMGGFKLTNVASATARTDSINAGQVQDGGLNWVAAGGTADAITATYAPALTALVDGQMCYVRAGAANATTTPTFAPNGLTAHTITKSGGVALAAGDIAGAGHEIVLRYNLANTRWELLNPKQNTATGDMVLASVQTNTGAKTFNDATMLLRNVANTFSGYFTNAITAARTWTLPDATGTIPLLSLFQTWSASQRSTINVLTDAATIAWDMSLGNSFFVELGGNRTLGVPTGLAVGVNQKGTLKVLQDKTGSRTLAYSWPFVWAGGTAGTLSTAGCTRDKLAYEVTAYNTGTVTITIATPGVVTFNSHGFKNGQRVQLTTTGALPTGLTASTTYFAEVIDANSFYLCTSLANVAAGTRIATSGSQSGTHTLTGMTIELALTTGWA